MLGPTFRLIPVLCLVALVLSPLSNAYAQPPKWRAEALTVVDNTFMDKQREAIDNLARAHFGMRISGDPDNDLRLLQRLLDGGHVASDDTQTLQAMGVVLGDLLKARHGLEWKIYLDAQGRSRALEVPGKDEFLFPITMISRRAEVGAPVDVKALWDRAAEIVLEIRGPSAWQ